MSLSKRIARGVKATFGAELLRLAAQAGIILLLTRVFLGPDEYGLVFLAISVFSVATLFGTLGIPKSTAKFLTEYRGKDESQVRNVLRTSITFISIIVSIVCVVFFLLSDTIVEIYDEPALQSLLALGVVYIVTKVAHSYLLIAFQGLGRVPLTALTSTVSSVSHLTFITIFLVLGFGTVGALMGYVVGYAIAVLVGVVVLYRVVSQYPRSDRREPGLRRRIAEYSLPLTASQGGNLLYKRVDTLMVGFFLTPVAVGFYELAKQVSTFVIAPADSLGFTVAPTFGENKTGEQLEQAARIYEQSLKYILLLYLPAVGGIVLLAEPGIQLIFGQAYSGAATVLQIFSVFVLFQAIDKITNDSLDYLGRATERAIGKGVTGTLNFGLNLLLIPLIGVEGAALSTSICFGLMVLFNIFLMNRELALDWPRIITFTAGTAAVTAVMVTTVYLLAPYVDGVISLVAVIAAGVLVWGSASVASGLVDIREVRTHI